MKIEIEIDDITTFAIALNNACASYGNIISAIIFGCDIPIKLEPLRKISNKELQARFECLKNVYKQIENIEKETQ